MRPRREKGGKKMKKKTTKERKDETYSYDEYEKTFYPSTAEERDKFSDDPKETGIRLAEESLRKLRQSFKEISHLEKGKRSFPLATPGELGKT